jgi:hypothetical protein
MDLERAVVGVAGSLDGLPSVFGGEQRSVIVSAGPGWAGTG